MAEDQDMVTIATHVRGEPNDTAALACKKHSTSGTSRGRHVLICLGKLRRKRESEVKQLQAQKQVLEARHAAMAHWARALEFTILATEPLRRAALAAAAQNTAGPAGASHLQHQEEFLQEYMQQLQAVRHGSSSCGGSLAEQQQQPQQLDASGGGGSAGAAGGAGCGASRPPASPASVGADVPTWVPLVAGYGASGAEELLCAVRAYERCTAQDYALRVKEFVQASAVDLFHIRTQSPSAPAAAARIGSSLDGLTAFSVALTATNPVGFAGGFSSRLDTLEPAGSGAAGPPLDDHWARCVKQMGLSPRQALETGALLTSYREMISAVVELRDALILDQHSCDDRDEAEELLLAIERCQHEFVWKGLTVAIALFNGILRPAQVAAAFVSAYPFPPVALAMELGLRQLQQSVGGGAAFSNDDVGCG